MSKDDAAYKTPVPDGVTAQTHRRVTMRNILDNVHGPARYSVTHEAVDFVPVEDVDAYTQEAIAGWWAIGPERNS